MVRNWSVILMEPGEASAGVKIQNLSFGMFGSRVLWD